MVRSVLVAVNLLFVISASSLGAQQRPRCEFNLEARSPDKQLRCYSLDNLTLLEQFVADARPVKVQVVNGPLDKFHLFSSRANRNEPSVGVGCSGDNGCGDGQWTKTGSTRVYVQDN